MTKAGTEDLDAAVVVVDFWGKGMGQLELFHDSSSFFLEWCVYTSG